MNTISHALRVLAGALLALTSGSAAAHMSPPVTLWSDADTISALVPGATRHYTREVRLTAAQRAHIEERCGWRADDAAYRFFIGRDARGAAVGAVIFLTQATQHGSLRVAVGFDPAGKVRDARIVQASEEAAGWARAVNERGFARYAGRDAADEFTPPAGSDMVASYMRIAVRQMHRAAVLFEVAGVAGAPGPTKGE